MFWLFLVSLAYDGSCFSGWAKQKNKVTAQGTMEEILEKVFRQKIIVRAVSRLDKGVHAISQCVTFSLDYDFSNNYLFCLLKRIFKDFFLIKSVKKKTNDFNILKEVREKEYRYFISTKKKKNIWKQKYRWEYNNFLVWETFSRSLSIFLGVHDFFNFFHGQKNDRKKENTIRKINFLELEKKKSLIVVKIKGKGFLRYQIRAMVGEAVSVCEKKQTLEELKNKLNCKLGSKKYQFLAPAAGLYLWKVEFKSN